MTSCYSSENMGEENSDIISRGYDEYTGAEIVLIACPSETIGGDGPVFDHIDKNTIYVLISDDYIEELIDSSPNEKSASIRYGMMIGDIMRRGAYYAQNLNKKKKRKDKKNEQ
jgi:hypothetical protein